eukprot:TRINITY_DN11014_c0_g1_i12.p1 TRINITY_DN11014_c0_g1~~TRINITY_DN11014_c0_g1_i12.p1  ORF type:complete len:295 (-),score=34.70 TRINITY_DN11014_c0_g1_i12:303-1187(-)
MKYFAYFVESKDGKWARKYEMEPVCLAEWFDPPRAWLAASGAAMVVHAVADSSRWSSRHNTLHPSGSTWALAFLLLQGAWRRELSPVALQAALIAQGISMATDIVGYLRAAWQWAMGPRRTTAGSGVSWLATLCWLLLKGAGLASCAWLTRENQRSRRATKYEFIATKKKDNQTVGSPQLASSDQLGWEHTNQPGTDQCHDQVSHCHDQVSQRQNVAKFPSQNVTVSRGRHRSRSRSSAHSNGPTVQGTVPGEVLPVVPEPTHSQQDDAPTQDVPIRDDLEDPTQDLVPASTVA